MSCDTEIDEFLKKTHTRLLLKYQHHLRAIDHYYANDTVRPEQWLYDLPSGVTPENIKAELATREHIPNKIEAKAIRKQKAKEKKHR